MELMISHDVRCAKAHIRLPIVIPLVAQGPTEVGPYGPRRPRMAVATWCHSKLRCGCIMTDRPCGFALRTQRGSNRR